ncbi:MAG: phosphoglycerate dehydrogenase [Methanomassiliicoccales archaeon]|nr:phosphoglycerate dehydrogenase [Methanomassiliicoccales archaeon]
MKILVTDEISKEGLEILRRDSKVEVDVRPNISHEDLIKIIHEYDGIIIRSGTKITRDVIDAGKNLKVIGRAGVGVDNVDVEYATMKGILVMNTPSANIISAAEHTMAMILALARNIVWADASLKSGKWERSKFTGIELSGKTLAIIGIGRVGAEVAKRAKAFQMRLIGYDPFISPETAVKVGVRLLPLDKALEEADIVTIHAPLTPSTYHLIGKDQINLMKPTAMLVNCARGGIIDEEALYEALKARRIAGAALDVFEKEPPIGSKLLELPNIVTTPHLGASTREAQERVSLEMAEHVKLFLTEHKITNAVNAPIGRLDQKVIPFISVAEKLGAFAFQLVDGPIRRIEVSYSGELATLDTKMLTISALIGVLSNITGENTNIINAQVIAKEKGIQVIESKVEETSQYFNTINVRIHSDGVKREVRGTAFPTNEPRLLGIDSFDVDLPLEGDFIMTTHSDIPGVIGKVGTILGSRGINIARMGVGRENKGGRALMLLTVDDPVPAEVLNEIKRLGEFHEVRFIALSKLKPREYMFF